MEDCAIFSYACWRSLLFSYLLKFRWAFSWTDKAMRPQNYKPDSPLKKKPAPQPPACQKLPPFFNDSFGSMPTPTLHRLWLVTIKKLGNTTRRTSSSLKVTPFSEIGGQRGITLPFRYALSLITWWIKLMKGNSYQFYEEVHKVLPYVRPIHLDHDRAWYDVFNLKQDRCNWVSPYLLTFIFIEPHANP